MHMQFLKENKGYLLTLAINCIHTLGDISGGTNWKIGSIEKRSIGIVGIGARTGLDDMELVAGSHACLVGHR